MVDDYVKEVFEHYNLKLIADFKIALSLNFVELNSISMLAVDNQIYVNWGVLGRKNFAKEKTQDNLEKEFLETIKYLSDPTKLNIIKYCLAEDRYGAEIAKELELTSATISHHMKDLTENNLITFTLDKKRIYYRTNKELILKRVKKLRLFLNNIKVNTSFEVFSYFG
ncbi:MAG: winged helix-turn-helix transcriptional regulator [Erysipelothrix sp.]|nr:winged helix-turn-helix transcriptional regulator [Erysipelothrix sp.]